jgi:hypothetical protein
MARVFAEIDHKLAEWIGRQHMFFVATAPRGHEGHVNVYDDHIGSGAETAAHLRENGRICVMFCSFDGPPRIVRLHGRGAVVASGRPTTDAGVRGVIRVEVERVADACGFGVPRLEFVGERPQREAWLARQDEDSLHDYMRRKNTSSIDGLPAFTA